MNLIKKKSVQTGLAAALALFLVLILHLAGNLAPIRTIDTSNMEDIPCEEAIGEIREDTVVKQQFVFEQDILNSFAVRVATYKSVKDSTLSVTLTDLTLNKKVQSWSVETKSIGDGAFQTFSLNQELNDVRGHIFELQITSDAQKGNAVTLWQNGQSLYQGEMSINNTLQDGQLVLGFNVLSSVSYVNYVYAFFLTFGFVVFLLFLFWKKPWRYYVQPLRRELSFVKQEKKKIIAFTITEVILLPICFVAEKLISKFDLLQPNTVGAFNEFRFAFLFVCLSAIALLAYSYKHLDARPEIIVFLLLLGVGSLYVFSLPSEVFISWDEAIHYNRAVSLSYCIGGEQNAAEYWLYSGNGLRPENYHVIEQLNAAQIDFQNMFHVGATAPVDSAALGSLWIICYLPSALGLLIGRIFHFPYHIIFMMGAFANLLLYSVLVYLAVRKVKSGKMILTAIALMTTTVFLASRYSYDIWVIGFFLLGMSYFLSAMQTQGTIGKKDLVVMWAAFFFGSFAKSIYFLIMSCLLFLPKEKFTSKKQHVLFKTAVLASMGALAAGMVLPFVLIPAIFALFYGVCYFAYLIIQKMSKKQLIIVGTVCTILIVAVGMLAAYKIVPGMLGEGDLRGGAVNPSEQYLDILNNPFEYIKILFNFLSQKYLSFTHVNGWTINFSFMAYVGVSSIRFLPAVLLILVAATDKNRYDTWGKQWKVRLGMVISVFATICLMATALYIDFTPYGSKEILGCQARYLIPLFYPFFALIGSAKIQNRMNRKWYNGIVIGISTVILLTNIWTLLISAYY